MTKLAELRRRRDHAAYSIGVATAEWRKHVAAAERIIEENRNRETELGPQILRTHGLDPDTAEYRIMPDGRVVFLQDGQYIDVGD